MKRKNLTTPATRPGNAPRTAAVPAAAPEAADIDTIRQEAIRAWHEANGKRSAQSRKAKFIAKVAADYPDLDPDTVQRFALTLFTAHMNEIGRRGGEATKQTYARRRAAAEATQNGEG